MAQYPAKWDGLAFTTNGVSTAGPGDFNGDGLEDMALNTGVMFGHRGSFPASFVPNGTNGFQVVTSSNSNHPAAMSFADVNGDGLSDLLAIASEKPGDATAYVLFGATTVPPSSINLSTLPSADKFTVEGIPAQNSGYLNIASAGDYDGDGIEDFLVSSVAYGRSYATDRGHVYLIYGSDDLKGRVLDIADLNGSNGFEIIPKAGSDEFGISVAAADLNGDGRSDIIVGMRSNGAPPDGDGRGESYVIFGDGARSAAEVSVENLNGKNGFKLRTPVILNKHPLQSVASAGDVNGDGFDDLLVSRWKYAEGGLAFVVFGKSTGFPKVLDVEKLDGSNGFVISGWTSSYGATVTSAADVNGDGFSDLVIGSRGFFNDKGQVYVIFGSAQPFPSVFNVASLNGSNGFALTLADTRYVGATIGAVDINGDGLSDLDSIGFVAFARLPDAPTTRTGTIASQRLVGGDFADVLSGEGGNDSLWGHGGDDTLDGGDGLDVAVFAGLRSAYAISQSGGVVTVSGPEGTDRLENIERVRFDDQVVVVGESSGNTEPVISGAVTGAVTEYAAKTAKGQLSAVDPDAGAAFTWSLQGSGQGHYGTFAVNDEGKWTYKLDPRLAAPLTSGDHPTETFSVRVEDGQGGSAVQAVIITVNGADGPPNRDPVIAGVVFGVVTLDGAHAASGQLAASDPDPGAVFAWSLQGPSEGAFGAFALGADGSWSYELDPARAAALTDADQPIEAFTVRLQDGQGGDDLQAVRIKVTKADPSPDLTLQGGAATDDLLEGGPGRDTASYAAAGGPVSLDLTRLGPQDTAAAGVDTLRSIENVEGSTFNDSLFGDDNANQLLGRGGDDKLDGGKGADSLAGAEGDDVYFVDDPGDVVSELPGGGTDEVRTGIAYVLPDDVENLRFAPKTLGSRDFQGTGNSEDNAFYGNYGNDLMIGLGGDDSLNGALGADTLVGGPGADLLDVGGDISVDIVVFDSLTTSDDRDAIKHFSNDRLAFDRSVFAAFSAEPAGALPAATFVTGTAAAGSDQHLIYDPAKGALYYDADGAGGAAQVLIALLSNKPTLDAGNFMLI